MGVGGVTVGYSPFAGVGSLGTDAATGSLSGVANAVFLEFSIDEAVSLGVSEVLGDAVILPVGYQCTFSKGQYQEGEREREREEVRIVVRFVGLSEHAGTVGRCT